MRKLIVFFAICISVFLTTTMVAFAGSMNIVESPNVKIIIDGKIGTYTDTPLIANDSTMLPLRAVLTNLGVKNDDSHIIWNDSEKSVTVLKDSTKIYLKVNSATALVNDKPIQLDVPALIYKDKTYIPVRFVAQSLGKKVVWDGSSTSVLIREESDYNQVKAILDKSNEAMKQINKSKVNMDMSMNMVMSQNAATINMKAKISASIDEKNKLMAVNMNFQGVGMNLTSEMYYSDSTAYVKNPLTGVWEKQVSSTSGFAKNTKTINLDANEALCAGLVIDNSAGGNETVLKGDVFLNDLYNMANGAQAGKMNLEKFYLEIHMDKNTYLVKNFIMQMKGKVSTPQGDVNLNADITAAYSDFNGNFEVKIPEDVIKNAVEKK